MMRAEQYVVHESTAVSDFGLQFRVDLSKGLERALSSGQDRLVRHDDNAKFGIIQSLDNWGNAVDQRQLFRCSYVILFLVERSVTVREHGLLTLAEARPCHAPRSKMRDGPVEPFSGPNVINVFEADVAAQPVSRRQHRGKELLGEVGRRRKRAPVLERTALDDIEGRAHQIRQVATRGMGRGVECAYPAGV